MSQNKHGIHVLNLFFPSSKQTFPRLVLATFVNENWNHTKKTEKWKTISF